MGKHSKLGITQTAEGRGSTRRKTSLARGADSTELLYLRLDPRALIAQAQQGVLTTETEVARLADTLRKHADHVPDLLVRARFQSLSNAVGPVLPALERSLNRSVQELLLILALHSKDQDYSVKTTLHLRTSLKETEGLIRLFRSGLGLDPNFLTQSISPKPSPGNHPPIEVLIRAIWPFGGRSKKRKKKARTSTKMWRRSKDPLLWEGEPKESSPVTSDLLDLSPQEFEALVANLLRNMGLRFQHGAPNDGGVDGIAADLGSEFGGKLVVQAKRYRHPVPVESVRSLYGGVLHQGASKGILITTSTFSSSAYDFAINKPLELIDGANLLYLLSEYAGIEANIATDPPR